MTLPGVYRAPLRSRDDRVPEETTQRRALTEGLVGMGEPREPRAVRRVERFRDVPVGALVWTRVAGDYHLGRITGECRTDTSAAAVAADLVHVRPCDWLPAPVDPVLVPDQVRHAFSRGGRNFQRIGLPSADEATARVWSQLA